MRIRKPVLIPLAALIALFALNEHLDADNHNIVVDATPDRAMARPLPATEARLGTATDEVATLEWRKRRAVARARELSRRGIHIREDDLDDWLQERPRRPVPPEIGFHIAEIAGGKPTTSLLSVGMLMTGKSVATAYSKCTVTLTRPDTILTARHCLSHSHGNSFWVYFPYAGMRGVPESGISFFCKENGLDCSITTDDLAIATLDSPYTFLPPAVPGGAATAAIGQKATIVGYGLNSPDLHDYGIKRHAEIELADCKLTTDDGVSLCFEHSLTLIDDGNQTETLVHAACNNDSGGPLLTPSIHWERTIGVASQMKGTCGGAGEGRYVNVTDTRYQEWLQDAYCDPACPVDSSLLLVELVRIPGGYLDSSQPGEEHAFTVPDGTSTLIVTLNHGRGSAIDLNDFDLELSAGLTASCDRFIEAEVCEVNAPPAGNYKVTVKRVNGEADYQLSAVALSKAVEPVIE
ncbi:MAG: trypsin-like serine protease [Gammaproteobacteria bacterium]|nr:trypsin-like serine protease [Woeseia sp.]MBT8102510.1 trypsin-like serine protease [Gammaproteobacteria bacterium]